MLVRGYNPIAELSNLGNTYIMGSDCDGMPIKASKEGHKYHVRGLLEVVPSGILRAAMQKAQPLLSAASRAGRVILIDPLPRYLNAKCCHSAEHIENY